MIVTSTIDWLSVTSLNNTSVRHPELNNQYIERKSGVSGYQNSITFLDGRIECVSPDMPSQGRHMIYSGEALRNCTPLLGLYKMDILKWHLEQGHRVSRIDPCVDAHNSGLSISHLNEIVKQKLCRTFSQSCIHIKESIQTGETLWFSKGQPKQLKIYDKAAEQQVEGDWIRIEMQTRGKYANPTALSINNSEKKEDNIRSVIKGYVDFNEEKWNTIMGEHVHRPAINRKEETNARQWILTDVASCIAKQLFSGDSTIVGDLSDAIQVKLLEMISKVKCE